MAATNKWLAHEQQGLHGGQGVGPSLAKDEWSYTIFTISYRNGFATVQPNTYGPFASKEECEQGGGTARDPVQESACPFEILVI